MQKIVAAALAAGLPGLALAQPVAVPAIATATAAAGVAIAAPAGGPGAAPGTAPFAGQTPTGPAPLTAPPPPVRLLSPSAPLNAKEQQGVRLAQAWKNRSEMPQPGEDGVVRFLYGSTLPTVVCAPLQVCDLALQPGEIVNNVNVGDKVRWNVSPGVSGSAEGRVTHLVMKPADAGLVSSLLIQTNRRTYAIKLVSTQQEWMPLVAFNYPDDMQRQWSAYQRTTAFSSASSAPAGGINAANLDFGYRVTGDNPGWRPLRVYTDGTKTYIQFPRTMSAGTAPALVALDNDGSWFSSPTEQMVNYRILGDRYVVDRVLDRAELIAGVGGSQSRVVITRDGAS